MENLKKKQVYTLLLGRLGRVQKDLHELYNGCWKAYDEMADDSEKQTLMRFADDVCQMKQRSVALHDDIQVRKDLAELRLRIENLASSGEEDEEEPFYW